MKEMKGPAAVPTADTFTISLPAAIAEQIKKAQENENRTPSELLGEAWRQYFESHYGSYAPTRAEVTASGKGAPRLAGVNTERSRRSSMTWTIHIARRAERQLAKAPAKSRGLLLAPLVEMQQNPFSGDIKRLKIRTLELASAGWSLSDLFRRVSRSASRRHP